MKIGHYLCFARPWAIPIQSQRKNIQKSSLTQKTQRAEEDNNNESSSSSKQPIYENEPTTQSGKMPLRTLTSIFLSHLPLS